MCHVLKCDFEAIKQFLDSMELDLGKLINGLINGIYLQHGYVYLVCS